MSIKTMVPTLFVVLTFFFLATYQRAEAHTVPAEIDEQQLTLGIIKPNAVLDNHIGEILAKIEKCGLRIVGLRMVKLSPEKAQKFYMVHKDRPFYPDLVQFMSSAPVVAIAIQGNNAVAKFRELVGATDPAKAASGTIRREFAKSLSENAIHGSDSLEAGKEEISFFFEEQDLFKH